MRVLVTGAYGVCGTAILDHLSVDAGYECTLLDREAPPESLRSAAYETVQADITDIDAVTEAMVGQDAVVHLAAYPSTQSSWEDVHEPNIVGHYHVLEAARRAEVDSFVFASTNHVVGMFEQERGPELYREGYGLVVDHTAPIRPDSFYGASKAFGEALGRFYVENHAFPRRFYALRIGNVTGADEDDPAIYARNLLEDGADPDGEEFERDVKRKMAMWLSRRDLAHLVDRCLQDDTVDFGVFYGVSDNANRWLDLERARAVLGYRPVDRAEDRPIPWDGLEEGAGSATSE